MLSSEVAPLLRDYNSAMHLLAGSTRTNAVKALATQGIVALEDILIDMLVRIGPQDEGLIREAMIIDSARVFRALTDGSHPAWSEAIRQLLHDRTYIMEPSEIADAPDEKVLMMLEVGWQLPERKLELAKLAEDMMRRSSDALCSLFLAHCARVAPGTNVFDLVLMLAGAKHLDVRNPLIAKEMASALTDLSKDPETDREAIVGDLLDEVRDIDTWKSVAILVRAGFDMTEFRGKFPRARDICGELSSHRKLELIGLEPTLEGMLLRDASEPFFGRAYIDAI